MGATARTSECAVDIQLALGMSTFPARRACAALGAKAQLLHQHTAKHEVRGCSGRRCRTLDRIMVGIVATG